MSNGNIDPKNWVEKNLKTEIPEVKEVVAV